MQTDIDMETNMDMDMDMGVKSVYMRAFRPREISQSTSLRSIQSNMNRGLYTEYNGVKEGSKDRTP